MDIQSKKLNFIEWLVGVKDESLINSLDKFRKKVRSTSKPMNKMSFDDLLNDLQSSENARKKGKLISIEDVEKESAKW
ncbi:MAG TPA: hypothetical protein VJY62_10430 [Bacteroidia bacterium]|nr:hypothetical protein [Bacteroidia bacterium]